MKKIFIIAALISNAAFANESISVEEFCAEVADFAKTTMTARQSGKPLPQMVAMIHKGRDKSKKDDADGIKLMEHILFKAYEAPRFTTKQNQDRMIAEHEAEIYLECRKNNQ